MTVHHTAAETAKESKQKKESKRKKTSKQTHLESRVLGGHELSPVEGDVEVRRAVVQLVHLLLIIIR